MSTGKELQDQGVRLFERDKYAEAVDIFVQAIEAYETEGDAQAVAEMRVNLGLVRHELGDYEAAIEAMQAGLAHFESADDQLSRARALGNMARSYAKLDETEQAQTMYREASRLFRELGENEDYANTVFAMADMHFRAGDFMTAIAVYEAGLEHIKDKNHRQKMMKQLLVLKNRLMGEQKQQDASDEADDEVSTDRRRRRRRLGRKQETEE